MFFKKMLILIFIFFITAGILYADDKKEPLRIGIGSMISPQETINVYQEILYYVGEKLDRPVDIVQRKTYKEMDDLLEKRNIDIAFVCSGPYVEEHDKFGVEILAAPQAYGKCVYNSYIIVNANSLIKNFDELKGRSFAFTDNESHTGYTIPVYMLLKMGQTPESFFSKSIYSGNHEESIKLVAEKNIDGASVHNLIWEYLNKANPKLTSQTKIIAKSDPYCMPPVVVNPAMDPDLKNQLRAVFLNMHNDEHGRNILAKVNIDKFVITKDSDYNSIREMKNEIKNKK